MMSELSTSVSRNIAAPRSKVFEAWLNPEMLAKFMTPMPGTTVPVAKSDATEGGRFEIVMAVGENEIPHSGTYKEISPHERLVFTWESPFSVPDSTVTLHFAEADGGTDVTLTHVKFPSEEARDNHKGGWTGILEALAANL